MQKVCRVVSCRVPLTLTRTAADVAAESSADDKTYAISAILRYRQKEKKDVEDVVVRVAE